MSRTAVGIYHDPAAASEAIHALVDAGVPVDEISVVMQEAAGTHDVPVEDHTKGTRGAVLGGAIGAALGAVGGVLVSTGVIAAPGLALLAAGPLTAAFKGAWVGGAFGEVSGLLEGLGRLESDVDLSQEDLVNGAALIAIHSDDLHDVAMNVLTRTGAERLDENDTV
ncbi:MAG: general stress protein [Gemmatimonadota bacterium]